MREEPETSRKFLQSYLFTEKFGNFFISTCHRQSSCMECGWYYETFAWKLDKDKHRTDWVVEFAGVDDGNLAITDHTDIIEQLNLKGKYPKEEEENNNE